MRWSFACVVRSVPVCVTRLAPKTPGLIYKHDLYPSLFQPGLDFLFWKSSLTLSSFAFPWIGNSPTTDSDHHHHRHHHGPFLLGLSRHLACYSTSHEEPNDPKVELITRNK
ncbi:hypothetical protein BDQ94DRAFT_37661 [Aspergillus welwitschiae]|uniref:Uncharacterized protein n=1 Tax=Aspergillus welwitschiae TaxID=1341132 RepID=A0A3F3Q292_9EURO|nr:hypothetical protein BDQ94DRAFT_37661 [Aspergillus welwitschiae]RDH33112.1 hypothetical protein BDQ94DRAFT_37661 [Aspergillus welwitschiae]